MRSGDYWLPGNYLMELFISLDILYRRIGESGDEGEGTARLGQDGIDTMDR